MGRKRQGKERKLRTREHVLADLSVNHAERHVLLRGFAVNRLEKDYGLDLMMFTYNERGEIENGHVFFQLKATDAPDVLADGKTISCRVELADIQLWQRESMPVILVLYNGRTDRAYWLYVQQYLEEKNITFEDFSGDQVRVTVRLPLRNRLGQQAVERFREFRNRLLEQMEGGFRHG
jgi:Domain of unknown function (DUF4365)